MTIGIDGSYAINENAGIGRYTYELLKHMFLLDKKDDFRVLTHYLTKSKVKSQKSKILFCHPERSEGSQPKARRDSSVDGHRLQNDNDIYIKYWPIPGKTKEWLMRQSVIDPIKLLVGKVDLWHAPHFISVPTKCHCPVIVTVHDISFVHFPNFHQGQTEFYNKMCNLAAAKADTIIADSKSTAKDFSRYFNYPEEKIRVIYLGYDREMYRVLDSCRSLPAELASGNDFILSVGTLEPRKNYPNLLRAYAKLPNDLRKKYPLKIVGGKGWDYQGIFDTVKELNLDQVEFLGRVSDQKLAELYNACSLFIYPSLYEGFGLPVLEAMACGAPVIASNVSSLPEVGGEAVEYIEPHNIDDIVKTMAKLLQNEKYRIKLGNDGIKQAGKFSWEKCAEETLRVYLKSQNSNVKTISQNLKLLNS